MSLLEEIKSKCGEYFLNNQLKQLKKRNPIVCNLKKANYMGILYEANTESQKLVKSFVKQLKESGIKKIHALGFVNEKEIPDHLLTTVDMDYICQKNLKWHRHPQGVEWKNFINEEFDILIDLTKHECIPINFLFAQSKAKFKVGKFDETMKPSIDFMLDIPNEMGLNEYIKQVNHYLNIIH